ncbi:MAG: GlxA family transcriptional regulator, partial [Rhodobacteraceae bacterium]|nr:GlxA family transcriptional regulator [Paracoccaceae bacterium]
MAEAPEMPARPADGVGRFVFLLLDRFTLMSFAAALEPLRLANRMAGKTFYSWRLVGEGGGEVRCSNGTVLRLDGDLGPVARDETVLVCGGLDIGRAATRPVLSWL